MGELAVAALLLVSPQTGIGQVRGQPDLTDPCSIDVKTSETHNLNVEPAKLREDWHYALVNVIDVDAGTCNVRGFIKGSEIRQRNDLTDYGKSYRPPVLRFPAHLLTKRPENNDCPF